jgi:hypothetical protein
VNICRPYGAMKNGSRPSRDHAATSPPPVEISCRFPSSSKSRCRRPR